MDAAAHDLPGMEAAGHQGPLRLVDGLADEVLVHQRGAVVGPHLSQHHQLGVRLGGSLGLDAGGVHRDEQEEVGEGEVGQDAPAPEQPLQVLQLLGLEVGVGQRQLGGGGHQASFAAGRAEDSATG